MAVLGIDRVDRADAAPVAVADAHEQHVLVRHRLHRKERVRRVVDADDVPDFLAGRCVERDHVPVERTEIDLAVHERDAAIRRESDHVRAVAEFPLERAALRVEGVDVIVRRRHVHHAVPDDRRCLDRTVVIELEAPARLEPLDGRRRDRGEIGVPVPAVAAGGKDPRRKPLSRRERVARRQGRGCIDEWGRTRERDGRECGPRDECTRSIGHRYSVLN